MKVTKSLILILLISNFGIFIYGINAEGANWKSYWKKHSKTTGYLYYYDKDSTVRPTKGIVKVLAKYVITEEGLQKRNACPKLCLLA